MMRKLLAMRPGETALTRAFTDASQRKKFEAIKMLSSYLDNPEAYNLALSNAAGGNSDWANELRIVQHMLGKGASGKAVEKAMIHAASHHHLEAVKLLSSAVNDSDVYYKNFAAATSDNTHWMQNLDLMKLLLDNGAKGEAVDNAYMRAGETHHEAALALLDEYVTNLETFSKAFTAFVDDNLYWRNHLKAQTCS